MGIARGPYTDGVVESMVNEFARTLYASVDGYSHNKPEGGWDADEYMNLLDEVMIGWESVFGPEAVDYWVEKEGRVYHG